MSKRTSGFLRIEGLGKSFGGIPAVEDLNLTIEKGEFISILGPSGCGKTTTLRIIAGFMSPDTGQILLDGQRIDDQPTHERGAAMVFQNYALFPHMTVYDNVAFGLRMRKTPKSESVRRVGEALELVRLPSYAKRFPRELSGGQQQRVALARAIVLAPQLLLLDEPLSNLDAKLRKDLRSEILEIHRLSQITTLFVTHDLEEAFSVSDRIAVMSQGRLMQFGSATDIFTRPQTTFVAEFVGHSNVFEGMVESTPDGEMSISFRDIKLRIPSRGRVGTTARFAIPSHLLRIQTGSSSVDNVFPARLSQLTYLGSNIQFSVELAGLTLTGEMSATGGTLAWRAGDDVVVCWSSSDMIEIPA
jgi:ABC-type Fe3+/spermidine/putrescine transport system ATPase subunit